MGPILTENPGYLLCSPGMAYGLKPVNKELMLWNNFHTIKYHWQVSNQYEPEKRGPKFKYQKNELKKRLVLQKRPGSC